MYLVCDHRRDDSGELKCENQKQHQKLPQYEVLYFEEQNYVWFASNPGPFKQKVRRLRKSPNTPPARFLKIMSPGCAEDASGLQQ